MVEKGIRCGMCHAVYKYAKANNKYMKDYGPSTELSYLMYWDVKNLYEWARPQKLFVHYFKWIIKKSRFIQKFQQNYDDDSNIQ